MSRLDYVRGDYVRFSANVSAWVFFAHVSPFPHLKSLQFCIQFCSSYEGIMSEGIKSLSACFFVVVCVAPFPRLKSTNTRKLNTIMNSLIIICLLISDRKCQLYCVLFDVRKLKLSKKTNFRTNLLSRINVKSETHWLINDFIPRNSYLANWTQYP